MTKAMRSSSWLREATAGVVEQLLAQGWQVVAEPGPEHLPASLAGFQLDLVARRGEEFAVVEVKSRRLPPDLDMITLAERVSELPGWQLRLVYLPEEPAAVDREQLLRWVSDAEQIAESVPVAALLLCWAATEGLLHRLGEQRGIDTDQPGRLLAALTSLGVVEHEEHDQLRRALESRNALAHGREGPVVDALHVRQLGDLARVLADRVVSSGAPA